MAKNKTKKEKATATPDTAAELVKSQTPTKELAWTVMTGLSPSDNIELLVRLATVLKNFHWNGASDVADKEEVDVKALSYWVADATKLATIVELAKTL